MSVFIYHVEKNGKLIQGKIEAKNISVARLKLNARKIDFVYIKQKPLIPFFSGGGKVKSKNLLFFTRQISFLLGSGVSLVQALKIVADTTEDSFLKTVVTNLRTMLEGGKSLSQAMKTYPSVFDGFYINMVVCSEKTGLLDEILSDLANYIEKMEMIKSRVKSAMMYPVIVLIISLAIISGIILFVVPKFASLYSSSGGKLPALTQMLVNTSEVMKNNTLILLAVLIGVPIGLFQLSRTEGGKKQIQAFVRILPVFKDIAYQSALVKFCRSFACLLRSGVNFLEALDVSYNISDHVNIQRGIKISRDYVVSGKSFALGLKDSKVFPALVYNMAKTGEESGKIQDSFERLMVYYEEILNNLISGMIKLIEPILIVVLGGLIAVIILALYLPVFYMGDIIS
ncbi:MAG: type II secretion system F family protein [Bdellovibrionales bacterium]|nr:type II secretion system F family protein [Bdellovibrionales bacterium]